jgi:hypothetical protein
MPAEFVLSPAIASFLEAGRSLTVASRDADLRPEGANAWAVKVHPDRTGLTVYLHEASGRRLLANLSKSPEIAILVDQPSLHRACQVKGTFLSSRKARAGERPEIERQIYGLAGELERIGVPGALLQGWETWPCVAFEVRVSALFEQTPGPGAGEPLRGPMKEVH